MEKQLIELSYKIGYEQAVADIAAFLLNVPPRHEGTPLFGQETYREEYKQYVQDTPIRAKLRAEQIFDFGEGPKE